MEFDFLNLPHWWSSEFYGDRVFAFDAFVSHAGGDRSTEFVERLRSHKVTVWHDGSQEMGDARWRMRLINALLHCCYVVLFVDGEHDISKRDWVIAEWQSALEAERLSGVPRLVIAKRAKDTPVPPALSEQPQYVIDHHTEELSNMLIAGNRLPSTLVPVAAPPSIAEAEAALSRVTTSGAEGDKTETLFALTERALAEVQASPEHTSHALYQLWVFSHAQEALDKLDLPLAGAVVIGLEALASVGHSESRTNSCFMLHALALRGCKAAGEALVRVLRREEDGAVLDVIFGWFRRDQQSLPPLAPEDYTRILLILPSTNYDAADQAMRLAPPDAAPMKLRHYVHRITYRYFEGLRPEPKHDEAESRYKRLLAQPGTAIDWEIFFRGLSGAADLKVPLISPEDSPPAAAVETFLTFVERFADEGARRLGPRVWHIQYETAVLQPLAMAHAFGRFGDRPLVVYRKFLAALEAPVREDLKQLKELRSGPDKPAKLSYASLLHDEMKCRQRVIKGFREGPFLKKQEDGLININLLSSNPMRDVLRGDDELRRKRIILKSIGDLQNEPLEVAAIWERWRNIPLI